MVRLFSLAVLSLVLNALVLLNNGAAAGDPAPLPKVKSIQLGFNNHFKLGCWTPVEVTFDGADVDSTAEQLDVQAIDGDGVPAWFTGPPVLGSAGQTAISYVRIGRSDPFLKIRLTKLDGTRGKQAEIQPALPAGATAQSLPATSEFIVELGASIGLQDTVQRLNQNDFERTSVVTLESQQQLPDRWYGYEGVDLVVISGTSGLEKSLHGAALDALEVWVRQGGKLMVCCGNEAQHLFGPAAPLARFAPGELVGVINLPAASFGPIEEYVGVEQQRLDAASIRVSEWKNLRPAAQIEWPRGGRASDLPLIMRRPLGFGEVTFVSLDLHRPPFTDWASRSKFLERLLVKHASRTEQSSALHAANQGKQLGYVDLSGQLRSALDQFTDVQLIPFWVIALAVIIYISLLFPLNFWIVTQRLRRPTFAWALFPSTIIVFGLSAYALANYAKGNGRHVNQLDLVDVDLATGGARGATWFNVFSPQNALCDFRIEPTANVGAVTTPRGENDSSCLLSWFGLAGTGLGGMNSVAVNTPLFDNPYTIDMAHGSIAQAPLPAWSSKSFVARWEARAGGIEAHLTTSADRRLRGVVVNRLATPLYDCVLLFDRWAYTLEMLVPGKSVSLDRLEPQTGDTYLTNRRTINAHDEVPTYDRAGVSVARIVEVMMFHEAAGGPNYTGLVHRYQRFVDLSDQLQFGRAILVGRGPDGAIVQLNGQPLANTPANQHTTIYRFVLPVKSHD
jgi:hypothetical protein